jgi:acyl dehydratase
VAIPASLAGAATQAIRHEVDARWLMAYAAGLEDLNPRYLDTLDERGVVGHPLFPVCPEWPAVLATRDLFLEHGTPLDELRRGIHASHDMVVHRPVAPGDRLDTVATIVAVEARRPGAFVLAHLCSTDQAGEVVADTWQGSLYLGAAVEGEPVALDGPPARPEPTATADLATSRPLQAEWGPGSSRRIDLHGGAAHVYTECARIWNPIHTDPQAAQRAGLDGIILHGTATLALAVTAAVDHHAGGDPTRVARVACRFSAMVALPSHVEVRTGDLGGGLIGLSVLNADNVEALRDAFVQLR